MLFKNKSLEVWLIHGSPSLATCGLRPLLYLATELEGMVSRYSSFNESFCKALGYAVVSSTLAL